MTYSAPPLRVNIEDYGLLCHGGDGRREWDIGGIYIIGLIYSHVARRVARLDNWRIYGGH